MDIAAEIRESMTDEWLPVIYERKVRSQRTRSYSLDIPERANEAEIQHTLLGIELKIGKLRVSCPDLATARYLQVFARIGCRECAVPYDITKISAIADELETSRQKTLLKCDAMTGSASPQSKSRAKNKVLNDIRAELKTIGPGEAMPAFKQTTRQRNS
jgi:hypothetical protein